MIFYNNWTDNMKFDMFKTADLGHTEHELATGHEDDDDGDNVEV